MATRRQGTIEPLSFKAIDSLDSFCIQVGISKTFSWSTYFFAEGMIPRFINATFLALIPNISI